MSEQPDLPKCPFDEDNHTIGIDDPCPVCGMSSGINEWTMNNKCIGIASPLPPAYQATPHGDTK